MAESMVSFNVLLYFHYICVAYMSSPAHVEIIAEEKNEEVAKEAEKNVEVKLSKKQIAQSRGKKTVVAGGGI